MAGTAYFAGMESDPTQLIMGIEAMWVLLGWLDGMSYADNLGMCMEGLRELGWTAKVGSCVLIMDVQSRMYGYVTLHPSLGSFHLSLELRETQLTPS
jgi:hypothetical protein